MRADRQTSQGGLPADADGSQHLPGACGSAAAVCIARGYLASLHPIFDMLPSMVERRRARESGHQQGGQDHGIVLGEAAILLLIGAQGIDDDVRQGTEPECGCAQAKTAPPTQLYRHALTSRAFSP